VGLDPATVGTSLDLHRIAELGSLIGSDFDAMLSSLVESMASSIKMLEEALRAGELAQATQTAHSCRNDALMVGARTIQEALSDVETLTRKLELDSARAEFERVRAAWPATRAELERAAAAAGSGDYP
jgi:HPt (histidine-containing phosphotransfer) domain-containing protein